MRNSPLNSLHLDRFDALLFDLDGTLADSMEIHNQAWIATLQELGYPMTHAILQEYAGIPNPKTTELFNERFGWSLDPHTISIDKESRFLKNVQRVRPIHEVLEIARKHHLTKAMAIVSGGSKDLVRRILAALQIEDLFPVRICAEDTPRGKPHPDPFLFAAHLLKVSPEKCLVFEDGEAGIQGAKEAGMGIVHVGAKFDLTFLG
ncbi:HAD family phosphatase [Bdellovibrionota bacterium FG-1]